MLAPRELRDAIAAVEGASAAFLQATSAAERTIAENLLLQFRKSSQPLPICHHLLEHSAVPYARFQALCTLRECLGREWPRMSASECASLQELLLRLLASPQAPYVHGQAVQVLALHAKLAMLHAPPDSACVAMDALLAHVAQLFEADAAQQARGMQLLHGLLGEFGAPHGAAAAGGLSWALHARARLAFQQACLLPLFCAAAQQLHRLQPLHAAAAAEGGGGLALLTACASLLSTALCWDFEGVGAALAAADEGGEGEPQRAGLNATSVRPPSDLMGGWREALGGGELTRCALALLAAAVEARPPAQDARAEAAGALEHALRQLLVQLGSVGHRLYGSAEAHAHSAQLLLHAAATMCGAPHAAAAAAAAPADSGALLAARLQQLPAEGGRGVTAALVDGSVLLLRLVASGGDALASLPSATLEALLALMHKASMRALHAAYAPRAGGGGGGAEAEEVAHEQEAVDVLMEVWVSLLGQLGGYSRSRPPVVDDAAWGVYGAALRLRVAVAGGEALESHAEEQDDEAEAVAAAAEAERHVSLAMLGRARVAEAAALLQEACAQRGAQLQQAFAAAEGGAPPAAAAVEAMHEETELLVRLAGHLLADGGEGSDAREVPMEVAAAGAGAAAGAAGAAGQAHPAVALSEAVLALLQLQLRAVMAVDDPRRGPLASVLSPTVGTTLLWFAERLVATYLMPDEAVRAAPCPPL